MRFLDLNNGNARHVIDTAHILVYKRRPIEADKIEITFTMTNGSPEILLVNAAAANYIDKAIELELGLNARPDNEN